MEDARVRSSTILPSIRALVAAIVSLATLMILLPPSHAQEIPPEAPDRVAVSVDPDPFSPNRDGRRDRTTITVEVAVPSSIEIRILDAGGELRQSWSREAADAPSVIEIMWDGRVAGRRLPDGRYTVRAIATSPADSPETPVVGPAETPPAGPSETPLAGEAETTVIIDTRPPAVSGYTVRPSRLGTRWTLAFRFTAGDRAPRMMARLAMSDTTHRVGRIVREVTRGTSEIRWRSPRRLYPGNYRTILRVQDDAGNISRPKRRPWRVERPAAPRVYRRLAAGRRVALTFDDCHHTGAWRSILGTLARFRVKATFFCPGTRVYGSPTLARRTVRQGHTPASHAWDHAILAGRGTWFTGMRVRADARAWWNVARATSAPYMRPPYGAYDAAVVRGAGANWHPRVIMWDVDPQDWRSPGVGTIVSRVVSRSRPGSIILLHTLGQTARALPSIIRGLRGKGLRPVSLPVLFRAAGKP